MINAVRGRITSLYEDHIIIETPGGVEYRIEISSNASSFYSSVGEKENVKILTYLQAREDSVTLFGFMNEEERFCFVNLQTVPGIGARQAIRILSGITVNRLIKALDESDVQTLSNIPGIGNKTAQKLVLQLRNVLVLEENDESLALNSFKDLISSLCEMGYERRSCGKAVEKVLEDNPDLISGKSLEEAEKIIFPLVLKVLSK